MSSLAHSPESDILGRVIDPENPDLTPAAARGILNLRFSQDDLSQMDALAQKARDGLLTPGEQDQLHGYLLVGSMIDLMHSKARLSLKRSGG